VRVLLASACSSTDSADSSSGEAAADGTAAAVGLAYPIVDTGQTAC
jgi:hypothetical protein